MAGLVLAAGPVGAQTPCPERAKDARLLWSELDGDMRPPPYNFKAGKFLGSRGMHPTNVVMLPMPLRLGAFDTRKQMITVEMDTFIYWHDVRLAYNASCLLDSVTDFGCAAADPTSSVAHLSRRFRVHRCKDSSWGTATSL